VGLRVRAQGLVVLPVAVLLEALRAALAVLLVPEVRQAERLAQVVLRVQVLQPVVPLPQEALRLLLAVLLGWVLPARSLQALRWRAAWW
jgi:hypothetical protein